MNVQWTVWRMGRLLHLWNTVLVKSVSISVQNQLFYFVCDGNDQDLILFKRTFPINAVWKGLKDEWCISTGKLYVSEEGMHLCGSVYVCLQAWLCAGVLLQECICACMFIIHLIVYGSCFLWHNKPKLLNLFAADNAISQGYPEWVKNALGSAETSSESLWCCTDFCSTWTDIDCCSL